MIYSPDLREYIIYSKRFIPRRLNKFEHLRLYHRYWMPEFGEFKVRDTSYDSGTEYYYITHCSDTKQAVLSYPIYNVFECFELLRNYNHIEEDYIINNKIKSFTGAEIRFWFISNEIDFTDDENYSGFLPYLEYGNNMSIKDSLVYQCQRNKKQNRFEFIQVENDNE